MAQIIIVDDYSINLRTLSHMLRRAGHTVDMAGSGEEALHLLNDGRFDLAILDIAMPEMDGVELLEHIKSMPPHQTMPIVMLTASSHDEDRIRAEQAGADAFLTKPTSSEKLSRVISQLIS